MRFICQSCVDRHHSQCRGETWCDCQHHEVMREFGEAMRRAVEKAKQ